MAEGPREIDEEGDANVLATARGPLDEAAGDEETLDVAAPAATVPCPGFGGVFASRAAAADATNDCVLATEA